MSDDGLYPLHISHMGGSFSERDLKLTYKELNQKFPPGSAIRQEFEREFGPITCGHVRCEGYRECRENQ